MKKILADIVSILLITPLFAQTPDMYPPPVPTPVEPSTLNIVLYVILPLLLIVGFILYQRWSKKSKKDDN